MKKCLTFQIDQQEHETFQILWSLPLEIYKIMLVLQSIIFLSNYFRCTVLHNNDSGDRFNWIIIIKLEEITKIQNIC